MQNFFRYDFANTLGWKVIESAPILVSVLIIIFQPLHWVLVHVAPLAPHGKLLEQRWILLLDLFDLL